MKAKSLARSFAWWPAIHERTKYPAQNCTICANLKNKSRKIDADLCEKPTTCKNVYIDYFGHVIGKMLFPVVDAHSK